MSVSAVGTLAPARDPFLDAVRTWAILRVVSVHILALAPTTLLFWPAPTFVMPGMPLVFFVSGALALRSLDGRWSRRGAMSPRMFWNDRFRRLLLPFWVYVGIATFVALVLDRMHADSIYSVDYVRTMLSAVPLLNPLNSRAGYNGVVHLWFLVAMAWLLLAAPLLARLHRRFPKSVFLGSVTLAIFVPYLHTQTDVFVWAEVNAVALFQFFFILGFWYTDRWQPNRIQPDRRQPEQAAPRSFFAGPGAFALAALSFSAAWLVWQWEQPPFVNASALVHGLLGLGWLSLILRARPLITALAVMWRRPLSFLNRRALTIYLYGWPATALTRGIGQHFEWQGAWGSTLFIATTILLIAAAVVVFGPLEDRAAGRQRATLPSAATPAEQVSVRP